MKNIYMSLFLFACLVLVSCATTNSSHNQESQNPSEYQSTNDVSVYGIYQAENSELNGVAAREIDGIKYVMMADGGSLTFRISAKSRTKANLKIRTYGLGPKTNNISVNGDVIGTFNSQADVWTDEFNDNITLVKGENTIQITPIWGWIYIDYIQLANPEEKEMPGSKNFVTTPCNPNATAETKKLMAEIGENYGKKIISGQMDLTWKDSVDMANRVYKDTGKLPKLMGFDFMNYLDSTSGSGLKQTEEAISWWLKGGYVQFCWHWRVTGPNGNKSFSTVDAEGKGTDFKIPYKNGSWDTSSAEYRKLLSDMDKIAKQLKKLQDMDVPVLWRPLHEGAGNIYNYDGGKAWFWWGNSGAEAYIALWRLMYDRFTNYHELNNLLWVWNGQAKQFYPGDEYVDFVGIDIYDPPKNYSSKFKKFAEAVNYCDNPEVAPKMVALTENGTIPSPIECKEDGSMWAWFMTWNDANGAEGADDAGSFWTGEYYNDNHHKKEVYESPLVITLENY